LTFWTIKKNALKRMSKTSGKNIVLDIDATLVHTHSDVENFDCLNIFKKSHRVRLRKKLYTMKLYDVSVEDGTGDEIILSGVYRPYLKEFLDFCLEYFDNVIIWSAGRKKYVEKMCDLMFPVIGKRPRVIYNYDDCDVGREDYLKKPLRKLYKDQRLIDININEKNTFVLDDRDDTFSLNSSNGIQIPEFESDMTPEEINFHPDVCLVKLMCWLSKKEVKNSTDVRKLDKDRIFTTSLKEYSRSVRTQKQILQTEKPISPKRKTKPISPKRKTKPISPKRKTKSSTQRQKEKRKE